nr:unnamed protein product [Leishmania braziliensis]
MAVRQHRCPASLTGQGVAQKSSENEGHTAVSAVASLSTHNAPAAVSASADTPSLDTARALLLTAAQGAAAAASPASGARGATHRPQGNRLGHRRGHTSCGVRVRTWEHVARPQRPRIARHVRCGVRVRAWEHIAWLQRPRIALLSAQAYAPESLDPEFPSLALSEADFSSREYSPAVASESSTAQPTSAIGALLLTAAQGAAAATSPASGARGATHRPQRHHLRS